MGATVVIPLDPAIDGGLGLGQGGEALSFQGSSPERLVEALHLAGGGGGAGRGEEMADAVLPARCGRRAPRLARARTAR